VDRAGIPGAFDASTIIVATGMRELDATTLAECAYPARPARNPEHALA
jgi:heterodisulfide reductase subunit A-like polyferredoxin